MAKIEEGSIGAEGGWKSTVIRDPLVGNGKEASAVAPPEECWLWRDKDRPVAEASQQGRLAKDLP